MARAIRRSDERYSAAARRQPANRRIRRAWLTLLKRSQPHDQHSPEPRASEAPVRIVSRRSRYQCVAAALAVFAATPAGAAENYVVRYDGAPPGMARLFDKISNLKLERRSYPTAAAIRRIGASDKTLLENALKAAGYYAAKVEFRIEGDRESGAPLGAVFAIAPGPLFRIATHVVVYDDDSEGKRPNTFEDAGVAVSEKADGASLENNQSRFLAALFAAGFPEARIIARRAEARLEDGVATAVYVFASGRQARFNGVTVEGAPRTDDSYLADLKTWEDGETFDRARLVEYRDRLAATGLFASIDVEPGRIDDDGGALVRVVVKERKARTIGAGVSFSTTEGPGARLYLEHRNILRRGESARVEVEGSEVRQAIDLSALKPLPRFPGAAFAGLNFANETTDAFDARSLALSAGLSKKWLDDRLETRAGLAFETSKVEPRLVGAAAVADERTYFVSAPVSLTWSTEDDPLALTKGLKTSFFATPYAGADAFTRLEATIRSRTRFGAEDRFTLAGRARFAATLGSGLRDLPVNKRVFSGGGSSVRGYDYQAVGPLDVSGTPVGGRSAVEAALEARARVYRRLELAVFADAGGVHAQSLPDFAGDYLVGAGAGLRYHSPIGPIRIDIATPLERRATDRAFQLYISIGQPF